VGVARQYCEQVGKQDNCQVAVSLSLAGEQGSVPIAWRLYLPQEWADDGKRRETQACPRKWSVPPRTRLPRSRSEPQKPNYVINRPRGAGLIRGAYSGSW
jgi:DDE superfamily endonuclease